MRRVRWLRLLIGWLAVACVAILAVLNGRPEFSNASVAPRGVASSLVALEVARNVDEVDSILGEAPSPDRETMRIKQYIDFGFIGCWVGLYVALGVFFQGPVAMAAAVCGVAAGAAEVMQNIAILRIVDTRLRDTSQEMVDAIRYPGLAKWALAWVAAGLIGYVFLRSQGWVARVIGGANVVAAVVGIYGLFDNAFLVWAGVPMVAGLAGVILRFLFR